MAITHINMTQDEPVHFRVRGLEPMPPLLHHPGQFLLRIELLNHHSVPRTGYALWPQRIIPYRDEIWEAIRTQAVYWVDWSRRQPRPFPRLRNDALDDRLLLAVKNRQLV